MNSSTKKFLKNKLKKLVGYLFSLKFYAGVVATVLLVEGKIDGWMWITAIAMVLASRQFQHLINNKQGA